jgi:hypothetical protein
MIEEPDWDDPYWDSYEEAGDYDRAEFKRRLREFWDDFSIQAYLKLREDFPGVHIPIYRLGGFESIFPLEERLKPFGIGGQTLASVMDASPKAIERVCLVLLEELDKERMLLQKGQSHLQSRGAAPTASLCLSFVCICYEAMEWNDAPQNISALHFLQQQPLLPGVPVLKADMERRQFKASVEFTAAIHWMATGKLPSYRVLAKILNVAPSSISRLFSDSDEYRRMADAHAHFLEEHPPKTGPMAEIVAKRKERQGR